MRTKLLSLFFVGVSCIAQDATVSSPDGKLKLDFNLRNGVPTYCISYDGQQALMDSPLGFEANTGDFSGDLRLDSENPSTTKTGLTTSYTLNRSKFSQISKDYNQLCVNLTRTVIGRRPRPGAAPRMSKLNYTVEFRVENNDVAFRYVIPNQPSPNNEKTFSIRIMDEKTGFRFPESTTTFLTPQSDAMVGWKGTKPSYEEEYRYDQPMTELSQFKHGYTFPCLFKVPSTAATTAKGKNQTANDLWVLISETDVDSRYCASRLSDYKDGYYKLEFPMAEENGGNGTLEPAMSLPNATPWRTITIGRSLKPIVETTIPWDFVTPRYETKNQYQFGKGTWSWIVWQDNSINVEDQKQYIALSKAMGYKYVLIDNWWDNNIGHEKMEELIRYAQSQGVDVFLWYSSSGWWNDIEQGPINIMSNSITRKAEMRWMNKMGVKGIKVDFFGGDKQETIRHYEQILSDADDNGLMVIFHGCTIPRGWERMYPNYVGSEAVLASENLYFGQGACDKEAKDAATHPFIRNAIGCMEFGGCFMNRHIHRGNKGGNTRRTTDVHELATCILFQNPIQNFAITPENLGDNGQVTDYNADGAPAPVLCMDFLREVPTTWDETRYIAGYPGKYVVLARRSGNKWYIAGNNATGSNLTVTLTADDLKDILVKGQTATLYSDNLKNREPQKADVKFNGKSLSIVLPDQGGFVIEK